MSSITFISAFLSLLNELYNIKYFIFIKIKTKVISQRLIENIINKGVVKKSDLGKT
ncbi:MAG: hypothetical protein QXM96_01170 [Candidatus Woesearchaeota archaeon]